MPVRCDQYEQVCVITIEGDLSAENAAEVRKIAQEHIDNKQMIDFVIDMEKVTFIDSEGLETLLWLKRRCDELFGQIKLVSLDDNCRKILEITRLEHRFDCQAELTGALKMMR
jgi:anti-anti-sigma factor